MSQKVDELYRKTFRFAKSEMKIMLLHWRQSSYSAVMWFPNVKAQGKYIIYKISSHYNGK